MNPTFINYTPHDIVLFDEEGKIEIDTFKAVKGREARVSEIDTPLAPINGIGIKQRIYNHILGLPEPQDNTYYIVSIIVLLANRTINDKSRRTDLIAPDTGSGVVRNEKGVIIGTKNFVCL